LWAGVVEILVTAAIPVLLSVAWIASKYFYDNWLWPRRIGRSLVAVGRFGGILACLAVAIVAYRQNWGLGEPPPKVFRWIFALSVSTAVFLLCVVWPVATARLPARCLVSLPH
jgi:hypothetical protein